MASIKLRLLLAFVVFAAKPVAASDLQEGALNCFRELCGTEPKRPTRIASKEIPLEAFKAQMANFESGQTFRQIESLYSQYISLRNRNRQTFGSYLKLLSEQQISNSPAFRRIYHVSFLLMAARLYKSHMRVKSPVWSEDLVELIGQFPFDRFQMLESEISILRESLPFVASLNFLGELRGEQFSDIVGWTNPWSDRFSMKNREVFWNNVIPTVLFELKAVTSQLGSDFLFFGLSHQEILASVQVAQQRSWENRKDLLKILNTFSVVHFLYSIISSDLKSVKDLELIPIHFKPMTRPAIASQFERFLNDVKIAYEHLSSPNKSEIDRRYDQILSAFPQIIEKTFPSHTKAIHSAFSKVKFQRALNLTSLLGVTQEFLKANIKSEVEKSLRLKILRYESADFLDLFAFDSRIKEHLFHDSEIPNLTTYARQFFSNHRIDFYIPLFHYIDLTTQQSTEEDYAWSFSHELGHLVDNAILESNPGQNTDSEKIQNRIWNLFSRQYLNSQESFDAHRRENFADAFAALAVTNLQPLPKIMNSFVCLRKKSFSMSGQLSFSYLMDDTDDYSAGYFRLLNIAQFFVQPVPRSCEMITLEKMSEAIQVQDKQQREEDRKKNQEKKN